MLDDGTYRRLTLKGLRHSLADTILDMAMLRLHLALKAGFRSDQPRAPAGNPDGGQWIDQDAAPKLGPVGRVGSFIRAPRLGNKP